MRDYLKERYDAHLYLSALIFMLLANQHSEIHSVRNNLHGLGATTFPLQSMIIILTMTLLFFSSFEGNTVLTRRNTSLLVIGVLFEVLLIIFGILMKYDLPENIGTKEPTDLQLAIMFLGISLIILSVLYTLGLLIMVLRKINLVKSQAFNSYAYLIIQKVQLGAKIMIFGPFVGLFVVGFFEDNTQPTYWGNILQTIISLIGIYILIHNFHRGGISVFQGDNLRRLIVINNSGLPVYSYVFKHFREEDDGKMEQLNDDDILFSGALTSISMLMSEFTGGSRNVKSIALSDLQILVYSTNDNYSIVLLVVNETRFYRNAMAKFAKSAPKILEKLDASNSLNLEQLKEMNKNLEDAFGQRIDWEDS